MLGQVLEATLSAHVDGVGADPDEALGQAAHRRGVRPAVVVQHHGDLQPAVTQVVEPLEGHAPGHGPVADHRDHSSVSASDRLSRSKAVGVGQHGRGVRVLDPVVARLVARRVARHPAGLPEAVEPVDPTGQQLVDIGLVPGVPEDGVPGAVENPVEGQRQLDDTEVGAQVASGLAHRVHDPLPDLGGQAGELLELEIAEVGGGPYGVESHGRSGLSAGPGRDGGSGTEPRGTR